MLIILAVSLLSTLIFEGLFALAWGLRSRRELTVVALVNLLTNPAVVLLFHTAVGAWKLNAVAVTIVLECSAVVVEWLCYRSCSQQLKRPFLFSLLANLCSYSLGFLLNLIF